MKRTIMIVLLLATAKMLLAAAASGSRTPSLDDLYKQIDRAIDHSPEYVAAYETRLGKVRTSYERETAVDRKFDLALQLYELYKSYNNDSALCYVARSIDWADANGRTELAGYARALMAYQCSASGMYTESAELLEQISLSTLTVKGRGAYYFARMHLCGEIAYYSQIDTVQRRYYAMQDVYRDSVLNIISPTSLDYLMLRQTMLLNAGQLEEALEVNDTWQNAVSAGTREHAIAAYYRHIVYDHMGRIDDAKYCLAQSALADIKCAVMDQASLITLASLLNYDSDFQRSYKYLRFTWDCNNRFNTRMRSWQISPILTMVEDNYQRATEQNIRNLTMAVMVAAVLALMLLLVLLYVARQRSQYKKARNELASANGKLQLTNEKLQLMNDRVVGYNKELFEIKRQLEEANSQLASAGKMQQEPDGTV